MMTRFASSNMEQQRISRKPDIAPICLLIAGLVLMVGVARWMDARQAVHAAQTAEVADDELYLAGEHVRAVVPNAFRGLAADWYWMRSLQYVGRKSLAYKGQLSLDDLSVLDLKILLPLLNTTVRLDPQFLAVYEYGAVVLPAYDRDAAVKFVEQGIRDNPESWRLNHHLGYIHWQRRDFAAAARSYKEGAGKAHAPGWMTAMAARIEADGGERGVAREMYARMFEEADDEAIKAMAYKRLLWLRSLDERDAIRRVLQATSKRTGRCPLGWNELARELGSARLRMNASGAPVDPAGSPYVLKAADCDVDLDPTSEVPYK